jgi:hypothetical protein
MTAKDLFSLMSPAEKALYTDAWKRAEAFVISRQPKKAKSFEVHHAIEHAHKLFLADLTNGCTAAQCENTVQQAFSKATA